MSRPHAIQSLRLLLGVAVALFALVALSYALALLPLGGWAMPVALTISGAKAVLIAFYFMELGQARTSIHAVVAVAILLFGLLVVLSTLDVATRGAPPLLPPTGGRVAAPAGPPR